MMKQCKSCLEVLPFDSFYSNKKMKDGRFNTCKECEKKKSRTYTENNRADIALRNKDRASDPVRKEYLAKANARYQPLYRERNPERIKARNDLNYAIRHGRIARPDRCSACDVDCTPHGHHHDYSKPFDVQWLCPSCHSAIHAIQKNAPALSQLPQFGRND